MNTCRNISLSLLLLACSYSHSEPLIAGVGELPLYDQRHEHHIFVDFVKALSEESGTPITIMILPFARSLQFVKNRQVDFHLPFIKAPYASGRPADYDYATETIFHVNFVLYDNRYKPVDLNRLEQFIIETDLAHREYFDFNIRPTVCIECSVKKLKAGRIDGLIYADLAIDPIIKKYQFKNIQRRFYKQYHAKIILPKGDRGGTIDRFLSQYIVKMRRSGKLQKIFSEIDKPYDNWQP